MNQKSRFVGVFCAVGLAASCGDDGHNRRLPDAPGLDVPVNAALTIDRATASFGTVTLGTTSTATTFTITNTGGEASGVLAAALSGTDAGSFALGTNTCTGTLDPAATCTVDVSFAPTAVGAGTATLMVVGMPGGTVTAALDGEGIGIGALTIASDVSALGSVVVGQTGTTVATFTVTNTGNGPTGGLSVTPAGSEPQHFVKSNDACVGMVLAPSGTCTFQVQLAPLSAGAKAALYQVSATPGGTVSGAVTGTGVAPASLRAMPLQLELGSVVVGQPSATMIATIGNLGGVASGPLTQSVTGSEFTVGASSCNATMLAPGTACTIAITFTPSAAGRRSAQLVVAGAPGGAAAISLVGDGIATGGLTISPSAHQFANTNVDQVSSARELTITNTSTAPTGQLTVSLGGDASQYRVIGGSDACTGAVLAPAGTCTISVAFAPTMGGVAHGALTVAGSPGGEVTASLLGLGVGPAKLTITPPARGFGSVVIGTMSSPLTLTVTNEGGQASGIPAATLVGTDLARFAIAGNTCTATLAPNATCTIQVRFAPTAAGTATAAVSVTATPGGTAIGDLVGDGIAAGGLVILPSSTTFPLTTVGDSAATQTLTVQNTGTGASGIVTVAATGDFSTTTNCSSLAPGATCTISVTFTPTATGLRTGTVTAGGTATAAVAGTAGPRLEIISLDSGPVTDPADLGSAIINNSLPHDVLILVRNNTTTAKPFGITPSFGSPAQYAVVSNTCGATIGAAGGLCTVGVRFAPTMTGPQTGSITFDIGAGAQNQAVQNLTGVGSDGLAITALAGTDFGAVPINTTAPALHFRVTNPAGSELSGSITTALTGSAAFSFSVDTCTGRSLPAGASCTIDVAFAPNTVAAAATTLSATASPGGAPSIAISGTGVSPIGSAPTDIVLTPSAIAENTASGSTVGTLAASDGDIGDTFSYALVGGAGSTDNGAFMIVGGMVRTNSVFDFETKASYAIRVRVTDSGGNVFEKALTIDVTNVDEIPVAVDDNPTILEDAAATEIDVLANDTDIDGGPKMIASVTQPMHGTVIVTGGGTGVTYEPVHDFTGGDTFTYTLNGGTLATVTVTVTPVDDHPVAVMDAFSIAEDSAATSLAVLANDTDVDQGTITITAVTQPANGTVVITGAGAGVSYAPAANFTGVDTFTYTLSPGNSVGTVVVTVTPIDDPPTATNDTATATEDGGMIFVDALTNDTDIDGGAKMVSSFTQPLHGIVSTFQTGFHYTPAANYFGPDTFTYTLNGGATATVTVDVLAVNDAPTFVKGADQTSLEDANPVTVDGWATMVSPGPANEAGQVLDFVVTVSHPALFSTQPAIAANGTLTFTPAGNANGTATITVKLHDDGGLLNGGVDTSATQTFTITLSVVNDAPVAANGNITTNEEVPAAVTLSATDVDTMTLTYSIVTPPAFGTLSGTGPNRTYTPSPNYFGFDSFTFKANDGTVDSNIATISITVNPINDAPIAANQDVTTAEETPKAITLTAFDVDNPALTYSIVGQPMHGTLAGTPPNVTYTPAVDYVGADSFTFKASDGGFDSNATVSITVTQVNDAPVAAPQSVTTAEDTATSIFLGATDVDSMLLTYIIVAGPLHGTLTGTGPTRTYTPAANYAGPDSFTFKANDGMADSNTATVAITVTAGNDAPVATPQSVTTAEDTARSITLAATDADTMALAYSIVADPTHGTLSGTPPNVVYTPATNYAGSDSFTFKANDGTEDSNTATVSITVTPVNDGPLAAPMSVMTDEDTPLAIMLIGTDFDGGPLAYTIVASPTHGTLTGTAPNVTYTPAPNYFGEDSFTFKVNDGFVDSNTATMSITITGVNDAPVAASQTVSTAEDTAQAITLVAVDIDSALTYAIVAAPTHGTLTGTPPNVTYVPTTSYAGADSFTFKANDGTVDSNTATVSITVTPVDDIVDANDDTVSTNEDTATTFNVLANDLGLGDGGLSVVIETAPSSGTASVGADNRITYTPAANFNGTVTLSYSVKDVDGDIDTATVTVTVNSIADATDAVDDTATTNLDTPVTINVLANDLDPDGDAALSTVGSPTNGTAVIQGSAIRYTPNNGFCSATPDTFTYSVVGGDTATVSVTVKCFFGPATTMATLTNPFAVITTDLDNNGIRDVVATDLGTNSLGIILNNGASVPLTIGRTLRIAAGDLNRDGNVDIVAAQDTASQIRVLLGNGLGGFSSITNFGACQNATGLSLVDQDRDGRLDILVGCETAVVVLKGNGAGAFTDGGGVNLVGSRAFHLASGDFNRDGIPDVASANLSGAINVFFGTGGTGLTFAASHPATTYQTYVQPADLDLDGDLDLVAASESNNFFIFLNNGSGVFTPISRTLPAQGHGVVVGDVTGDGLPDLVLSSWTGNQVHLVKNLGSGNFGPLISFASPGSPLGIALDDLDRDGRLDVITANYNANAISVMRGQVGTNAAGTFAPATVVAGPDLTLSVELADFNRDGRLDLVASGGNTGTVMIRYGDATGSFGAPTSYAVGAPPAGVAVGDLNRDGRLDIVTANQADGGSLLLGTATGFGTATSITTGAGAQSVILGDFNRDGWLDMAFAGWFVGRVDVVLSNGSGGYLAASSLATGAMPYIIKTADMNNDGKLDIVVGERGDTTVSVLRGDGAGGFLPRATTASPGFAIAIADIDRDGRKDILGGDNLTSAITFLRNVGGTTFAPQSVISVPGASYIEAADFNGDGIADVVASVEATNQLATAKGVGNGTFGASTLFATENRPAWSSTGDLNRDGKLDVVVANSYSSSLGIYLGQ